MSNPSGTPGRVSAVKLALMARTARARAGRALAADPIAIVGMGCRVPGGAETPDGFWSFLLEERNVARPVPPDRWDAARWHSDEPESPGRSIAAAAAFLDRIDGFDSDYFGIPAREADQMDPQQRLFLEVATEAIEDAGLRFEDLRGSRTGVFAASYHSDYAQMLYRDPDAMDQRTLTGTLHSVLANRLSYLYDLRGPSLSIDTACSASLVAIHEACQSLRTGESDIALAGGVSLMMVPELMVAMSQLGFLAPDGRCKTFDAAANGFGRGEGAAVLTLKRLSDALADRDRIWAVIRGSAVNQDGQSTLLAAPNGQAQAALVREAVATAQIAVEDLAYIETHGTGTALGDPIEVGALAEAVGATAADRPDCVLGAVKANIGHLEAAAGAVGVLKAALVLCHRAVPAQPGFHRLNPHIDLTGTRLKIADVTRPLPDTAGLPAAGVSSFGVGGTNAHVVLEAAPVLAGPSSDGAPGGRLWTLPISARSPEALDAAARNWAQALADGDAPLADLCFTAATRRSHHAHRLAVTGADRSEIAQRLTRRLDQGLVAPSPGDLCLVFCGQGPQHPGMGLDLMDTEPAFARHLERCDAAIRGLAGWSLTEALAQPDALNRTSVAQPALVALQTGLASLLRSWGFAPETVIGHSIGEVSAFEAAGLLSLEEALRLACHRGRIMQAAEGTGGMAALPIDVATARQVLARNARSLSIAAVNGPRDCVLSGDADALDEALAALEAEGIAHRRLPVRYAFHSEQMAGFDTQLVSALGRIELGGPARARVLSTVTGTEVARPDAAHFARGIRSTVRFAEAVAAAAPGSVFVEVGPHPVLGASLAACLEVSGDSAATILPTLRRGKPADAQMADAAARLYETGRTPDWNALLPSGGRVTSLPRYPWQHRRHWRALRDTGAARAGTETGHPLLGRRLDIAAPDVVVFEGAPSDRTAWLSDHRILGRILLPGAAAMELLAAALNEVAGPDDCLCDFAVLAPMPLPEEDDPDLRWQVIAQQRDGLWHLKLVLPGDAAVRIIAEARSAPRAAVDMDRAGAVGPGPGSAPERPLPADRIDALFRDAGAQFGPSFRLLENVRTRDRSASAEIRLPASLDAQAHRLHPAALDAGVQLAILAAGTAGHGTWLPVGARAVRLPERTPTGGLSATATLRNREADGPLIADVVFATADGTAAGHVEGLRFSKADALSLDNALAGPPQVCRTAWYALPPDQASGNAPAAILVVAPAGDGDALATALSGLGVTARRADPGAPPEVFAEALTWLGAAQRPGLVLECPGTAPDADPEAAVTAALGRLQAMLTSPAGAVTLAVLTQGAFATGAETGVARICCADAALQAFYASASAEHPELAIRRIDLGPGGGIAADGRASDILDCLARQGPSCIALRGKARLAPRLEPVPATVPSGPRGLDRTPDGGIDGLRIAPRARSMLSPGDVRVAVRAAGLNFRDVISTMGLMPGDAPPLGVEMAGEVIETGDDAGGLRIGDRVFGYAPGALAEEVTVSAGWLKRTPDALSDRIAAGLTVVFGTALYGLDRLAGLRAGERILIHAGTGGVGQAAIQIALARGAEVFATAGSEEKRARLRDMGVSRVMDSRDTAFEAEIARATGGAGVDVVLNSLAGAFIPASVRALSATGRFLELGKRELMRPEDFARLRPGASYHIYDLGQSVERTPGLLSELLDEVLEGLDNGGLHPVATTCFGLDRAAEAMRFMSSGQHVGKIVIGVPPRFSGQMRPDATYWITGGLGGLGLDTARWLAGHGARHILLTGRSAPDSTTEEAIAGIEATGATVRTACADAGDATDTARILRQIAETMPPLRGIVHAAGTVRDGPVSNRTPDDVTAVMRGKLGGALALHALTRDLPLDFFLLYSAAATFLGSPGQTLYTAANAGLDALAQARHLEGLPALSVAWGSWSGTGMAGRLAGSGNDVWQRRGLAALTPETAFGPLDRLLASGEPAAVVAAATWSKVVATAPDGFDTAPLAGLAGHGKDPRPAQASRGHVLRDRLAGLAPDDALDALRHAIADAATEIIGLADPSALDPGRPMKEMGLDSIMAVELRNALARQTALDLSATLLFDYPSVTQLTAHLAQRLEIDTRPETEMPDDTDDLTAAELEALLETELALSGQFRDDPPGRRS